MVFGFSTGSLALGDFRLGLQMVEGKRIAAIELSALRDTELESLLAQSKTLIWTRFNMSRSMPQADLHH